MAGLHASPVPAGQSLAVGFAFPASTPTSGEGESGRLHTSGEELKRNAKQADEQSWINRIRWHETGEITSQSDWRILLADMDAVVHLAARVHVMHDSATDAKSVYREANRETTLNLARQAAEAGVGRFVFISTVKVHGEGRAEPYTESDPPNPHNAYAISKWEAEQGLHAISAETGMEVVILRPPLVYGPGVKANFLRLMQWVERGRPLPLGAVHNRRSLLYLGNLVSAITHCIDHPAAAGEIFLLSDGEDISTPDLIRLLAEEMGRTAHLWSMPVGMIRLFAALTGKKKVVNSLLGSLMVDGEKLLETCHWQRPFTLREGLHETVAAYLQSQERKAGEP